MWARRNGRKGVADRRGRTRGSGNTVPVKSGHETWKIDGKKGFLVSVF
jgi:hypothetical protein